MHSRTNKNVPGAWRNLSAAQRIFLAHGVALVVLGAACAGGARSETTAAPDSPCAAPRTTLEARLVGIKASQLADGSIMFDDADEVMARHPLLATVALDIYRHERDTAFLSELYDISSAYINYVLAHDDSDGDFVTERTSSAQTPSGGVVEGVGFNAISAIDLLSLSRICTELDRPVEGLFWYQGMRTIIHQLIQQSYDSRAGFFFPMNNELGRRENVYLAMSAMPAYFKAFIGDNIATSVLRNYLVTNADVSPETNGILNWTLAGEIPRTGVTAADALRATLLLSVLHRNGLTGEANEFAGRISRTVESMARSGSLYAGAHDTPFVDYFCCLINDGGYRTFLPDYQELDLFAGLCGLHGVLPDEDLAKLRQNVMTIKGFLDRRSWPGGPANDAPRLADVERAFRQVFLTVSSVRGRWRQRNLFTPRDRQQIPGFDIYAAFDELLDDVVTTLQETESHLSVERSRKNGVEVTATPTKEMVTPGEPVGFRVAIRAVNNPATVRSITLYREQSKELLLDANPPLQLDRGAPAKEVTFHTTPDGDQGSLQKMRFTIMVQLADGRRMTHHFSRGVFISTPLTYSLSFPKGKILRDGNVPIQIELTKHVDRDYTVHVEWFSPAGLGLREGRAFESLMPAASQSGMVEMNVHVPTPCRPGSFPFRVKVSGNGEPCGTVAASLFKHYQWLYVGPFSTTDDEAPYPPEGTVDLHQSYLSGGRLLTWLTLPNNAYTEDGEIDLASLLPDDGVGYLHTVIKTASEKRTAVSFASMSPAVIIVNGDEVLRIDGSAVGSWQRVPVTLVEGMNNILIKVVAGESKVLFFQLGDDDDLTSDEFSNNLWELVDGFEEFHQRSQDQLASGTVQRVVTLTYKNMQANSVAVIGSFNGWSPVNSSMRKAKRGQWEISLHLTPGRYAYRFLVNNSEQVLDPKSEQREPDGYGGMNSVLFVR